MILISACITSILRTYYTWKIAQSPDISYNVVRMGLWTSAEFTTGIIISCFPVIPKFFQHIGPKVSSALILRSKVMKNSSRESASAPPSDKPRAERLKLPSFKHTFTSIFSNAETDDGYELYSQQVLPKAEHVQLHEETAMPRRDATRESNQRPAAKVATTRHDLERGYGMF